jgi:translation initiation factor IF-3
MGCTAALGAALAVGWRIPSARPRRQRGLVKVAARRYSLIPPPISRERREAETEKGPRLVTERDRGGPCRLIDDEGRQLGIVEIQEALRMAQERELDLVEFVSTTVPRTCKIMDFGKFCYDRNKKRKGQKKPVHRRKEIKLRLKTEEHDLQVKVDHARRFVAKGHKVLVTLMLRGREMMHSELGKGVLKRFAERLQDCAKVEKEPTRDGKKLDMILGGK